MALRNCKRYAAPKKVRAVVPLHSHMRPLPCAAADQPGGLQDGRRGPEGHLLPAQCGGRRPHPGGHPGGQGARRAGAARPARAQQCPACARTHANVLAEVSATPCLPLQGLLIMVYDKAPVVDASHTPCSVLKREGLPQTSVTFRSQALISPIRFLHVMHGDGSPGCNHSRHLRCGHLRRQSSWAAATSGWRWLLGSR